MEKLDEKVKAYIASLYIKWNVSGVFSESCEHCENFRQFEKWWYDEFLDRLPEEHDDYDENMDGYYGIDKIYSTQEFFENDVDLFSKCLSFVHNHYTELENAPDYEFDEPYVRHYEPNDIMTDYANIYVLNNTDLIRTYIPERLRADMDLILIKPKPA